MPQLVESGMARYKVFKWLDDHPFATGRDLQNEFRIDHRNLSDYLYQWKKLHQLDHFKKDLIFTYRFLVRKTDLKGPLTIAERESLNYIEKKVDRYEVELGLIKEEFDVLAALYTKYKKKK